MNPTLEMYDALAADLQIPRYGAVGLVELVNNWDGCDTLQELAAYTGWDGSPELLWRVLMKHGVLEHTGLYN